MANGVDPPKSGVSSESTSSAPNWQTSMMNVNSNEYKNTLNKKTPQPVNTSVSPVGNLSAPVTAPNANTQSIKDNVNTWKSSQAKEKARWNALTDDQKSEEQDKKLAEQQQQEKDRYLKNFYSGYGGVTTGAANIALGSGEEGELAGGFLPGVGEVIDAKNTVQDLRKGDYSGAAMNAAGFVLPFVPGKAIKKFFRGAEKTPAPKSIPSSNRLPISNKNTPNVSTTKPESSIFADGPRRYHNETGMEGIEIADMELNSMKKLGKQLDDEYGYFDYGAITPDNARFHGTTGGRPVAEVELPTGNTQMFYKSSGLAGKEGVGVGGTTEGLWQPYGGHVNMPNSQFNRGKGFNEQWFIKDGGYKDWYGSKSFKGISDNLDRIAQEGKWDMSDMLKASDQ